MGDKKAGEAFTPTDAAQQAFIARQQLARQKIETRRRRATEHLDPESCIKLGHEWHNLEGKVLDDFVKRKARTGLAFSGGGIRSATISLGFAEALAARGRFYSFDLMSTVSGGGYCGSFLRSLYVEREENAGKAENLAAVADRVAFADATLMSLPDQQFFRGTPGHSPFVIPGKAVKNPLWWLRENGRYLAPSGMSDYGYALSYIIRNWLTLLVFILGIMVVGFAAIQLGLVGAVINNPALSSWLSATVANSPYFSPLLPLLIAGVVVGLGISAGYWVSLPLPYGRPAPDEPAGKGKAGVLACIGLAAALLAGVVWLFWHDLVPPDAAAQGWAIGLSLALSAMLVSILISSSIAWRQSANSTRVDFRREQTRLFARYNIFLVMLAAITAIDCGALWLRFSLDHGGSLVKAGIGSGAIASVLSFLVAKLPEWFGGDGGGVRKWLLAHARHAALAAGIIILLAIALLGDLLVIKLIWRKQAWASGSSLEWPIFSVVCGVIALFSILLARSVNFVNLLALTPFYGSRLTRAYLGGANFHRLDAANQSEVTQGDLGDDLSLKAYMSQDGPAPLHLINCTRNRTVGDRVVRPRIEVASDDPLMREGLNDPRGRLASYESSLTLHDRHGDRMVFGPFGVRVGAEFVDLASMVDPPSVGLLCAISGAAVGSGMGRNTSLGSAMAFTLANVRLGYWWTAQTCGDDASPKPRRLLPGLSCLASELLGRFSTGSHWHLSDGGHSENSGALSLLERGCGFIVVADNGQDQAFQFADLEIFIRTARTDIGVEVTVVREKAFPVSIRSAAACFLNGNDDQWRARITDPSNCAFAVLLKATDIPSRVDGKWKQRHAGTSWIVWVKPNRLADLPSDIATYAQLNGDFPQQSTSNQFFDEAQWESYRRLGFEMGRRLFGTHNDFSEFLPVIYRSSQPSGAHGMAETPDAGLAASAPTA